METWLPMPDMQKLLEAYLYKYYLPSVVMNYLFV